VIRPRADTAGSVPMEELENEVAAAVRIFAERARRGLKPHVTPEDLLAYHEGQLADSESELIRDHLTVCEQCATLVLDLASFPNVEALEPESQLSDTALAQRWDSFQGRLRQEGDLSPAPALKPSVPAVSWRRHPLPLALAAGLFAASLGLTFWAVTLQRRLDGFSRPAAHVYISSLIPHEMSATRAQAVAEPTAVPAWADRILLILNLFEPRSYPAYQVEVFDTSRGGKKVWSSRDLRKAPDGSFAFEVPRSFLPAGSYHIELSGLEGARQYRLAVYELLLEFR
jgi:hypothetical protein